MSEKKQLNIEDLEKVTGGSTPSEGVAYLMLWIAASIEYKYKLWLKDTPNASTEQKNQKIKIIAQDIYNGLDEVCKKALDEYLADNPFDWEKMLKNIVNNNN